jgi:tetratricopeptide (TPR) repeat protein
MAEIGRAADLFRRADYRGARAEAEAMLAAGEGSAQLLRLAGLASCHLGDLGAGAAYLRCALEKDPADHETRLNLGRALAGIGAFQEADLLCVGSADAGSGMLRVHAYVLQGLGRLQEAEWAYQRLLDLDARDFEAWTNLGNARLTAGNAPGAVTALRQACELAPHLAVIRLNLAMALAAADRLEESFEAAREALRLEPRNPVCLYETAKALNRLGRHGEALELLGPAVRAAPREPMFQLEYGVGLAGAGRHAEAEERYRSALSLKPDLLPACLALGILYESSNRAAELAAIVEEALAAGVPEPELAYLSALSLKRQGRFEEALALAEQAPANTDPADKAQLIGEVCDRLGDTQRAFAAFGEMNRLDAAHPSGPRAAAAAYRRSVEAVAALTTRQWVGAWAPAEPKLEPAAPVFLVGFPRSGTTLLDTMLMAHPGLHVLEELPVLQRVNEGLGPLERLAGLSTGEIEALRGLYFEEVDALAPGRGQKMVVDKFPLAIGLVPLIHRIFPDARFIFAERHPCDVVLSCFMTRFGINDGVANFLDLATPPRSTT